MSVGPTHPPVSTSLNTVSNWKLLAAHHITTSARPKPTSPKRVTMNALDAARAATVVVVPEPDEQVAREAHDLPAHVHEQPAIGEHDAEHRGGEQRDRAVVPPEALFLGHVAHRVDLHEQAHERHHDEHHRGERVDREAELDHGAAEVEPRHRRPSSARRPWSRRGCPSRPRTPAPIAAMPSAGREHPGQLAARGEDDQERRRAAAAGGPRRRRGGSPSPIPSAFGCCRWR